MISPLDECDSDTVTTTTLQVSKKLLGSLRPMHWERVTFIRMDLNSHSAWQDLRTLSVNYVPQSITRLSSRRHGLVMGKERKKKSCNFWKKKKKSFLLDGPLPVPGMQIKDKDSIALAQQKKKSLKFLPVYVRKAVMTCWESPLLLTGAS